MAVKFSGVDSLAKLFAYLQIRTGSKVNNLLEKDKFLQRFKLLIEDESYKNTIAASSTAMQAVAASSTAMQAVINSSTALDAVVNSSTAMQAVAASSTAMQAVAASSTAMQAVINSSTALDAVVNSSTAMQAVAASSTAMQAVAASSTAMQAIISSSTARSIIQQSSHLSSVASTMYTTCNNDTVRFQKFDTYISVSQSTPTRFWTPTTGQTTSQPNSEACVCFCWKVVDNTSRTDQKIGIYSLEYVNTERLEVSLPGGNAGEVVNISPYEVLFGGVKCVDKIANAVSSKDLYFYGFKAL